MRLGAIVLCGGKSARMGAAKASLPFGDETMLGCVVHRLAEFARPVVVVTAVGQPSPVLPTPCRFAADARADRGPLEGLAAGLRAIGDDADVVFATSCDAPLVVPEFVLGLAERLSATDGAEVVVPWDGAFLHPLSAVYRASVLPTIERMLAADLLRPTELLDRVATTRVSVDELRRFDLRLDSLRNLNRPEDYLAVLAELGFTAPPHVLALLHRV